MKTFRMFCGTLLLVIFSISVLTMAINVGAVNSSIKTSAWISVAPNPIGATQQMVVNLWINPAPQDPSGYAGAIAASNLGFANITVTFTKPDGTKDTFMPTDDSLYRAGYTQAGWTESVGAMYFYYTPTQVGNWSVTCSFPGQTFTSADRNNTDTLYYQPSSSLPFNFVVQSNPVNAGIVNGYPYIPLPKNYWSTPVNINNREWAAISGDWLQSGYDALINKYNPYSTGPNSAHIVWRKEQNLGGLIGGDWGSLSYFSGQTAIVMNGKVYYNAPAGNTFLCLDIDTGQVLYQANGTFSLGIHLMPSYQVAAQLAEGIPVSYLINTATWTFYDPETGAAVQTLTNIPSNIQTVWVEDGNPVMYMTQRQGWNTTLPLKYAYEGIIKWDYSKVTGNNWRTGLVYNVSIRQPDGLGVGDGRQSVCLAVYESAGVILVKATNDGTTFMGFDVATGAHLWTTNTDYLDLSIQPGFGWGTPSGPMIQFDGVTSTLRGYDVKTGKEIWSTPIGEYPWGDIPSYYGLTISNVRYTARYDGYIYAVDMNNGKVLWQSDSVGKTGETVENTWTFGGSSYANNGNPYAAADGKLFLSTQTNYRGQPKTRGCTLFAVDAATGKFIWNVTGAIAPTAVADGYLLGINDDDGYLYAFGKGKTAVTVEAPSVGIQTGTGVLIQGTVTDQSPGAPGTPAVSDSSMTEWMNYLYMQNATLINNPPTPKGVPVHLTATDSNGVTQDIGTVTSEAGTYAVSWTPTASGIYTITATFGGSESYWSSSAVTHALVNPSSQPSATSKPTTSPAVSSTPTQSSAPTPMPTSVPAGSNGNEMIYVIVAAAVIIIVVVLSAVFLIVNKRKKTV